MNEQTHARYNGMLSGYVSQYLVESIAPLAKTVLVGGVLLWALSAHAINAVSAATMAATRGSVTVPQQDPATQAQGLCFFQVPRRQQWVNLAHVQRFAVNQGGFGNTYQLQITFSGRENPVEIPIERGQDISELPNLLLKRIEECREGRK